METLGRHLWIPEVAIAMKVQANLKVDSRKNDSSKVDFAVNPGDTVQSVKERIAASQLIALPEQDLLLDCVALE